VKLSDHRTLTTEGMRKTEIEDKNGKIAVIKDMIYVPGMQCDRISVGRLVEKGYSMSLKDNYLKLVDKNKRLVLKTPIS
jgi:hypothetical protein